MIPRYLRQRQRQSLCLLVRIPGSYLKLICNQGPQKRIKKHIVSNGQKDWKLKQHKLMS